MIAVAQPLNAETARHLLAAIELYARTRRIATPQLAAVAWNLRAMLPEAAATGAVDVTTNGDMVTINEYADGLGISRRTVRDQCERGALPGARKVSGRWRIPT